MSKQGRPGKHTRGKSSISHKPTMEERVPNLGAFDNDNHQRNYNAHVLRSIYLEAIVDWQFLDDNGLERGFFKTRWRAEMLSLVKLVKAECLIMGFWFTIEDGVFAVGNMVAKRIQDPMIRLANPCITTTISGRKDST
nr:hypothetical protein [Tanacetum cinerariifolium]